MAKRKGSKSVLTSTILLRNSWTGAHGQNHEDLYKIRKKHITSGNSTAVTTEMDLT